MQLRSKGTILVFMMIFFSTAWALSISSSLNFQLAQEDRAAEEQGLKQQGFRFSGEPFLEYPFRSPFSSKSLLVPTNLYWDRPAEATPGDMLADLDVLSAVFETAYGGYEIAEKHGWNWQQFFGEWRHSLENANKDLPLPIATLILPFSQFKSFQIDNHTKLWDPLHPVSGAAGSRTALLSEEPHQDCTAILSAKGEEFPLNPNDLGQQPRAALLRSQKNKIRQIFYLAYPNSIKSAAFVKCGSQNIRLVENWHVKQNEIAKSFSDPTSEKAEVILSLTDPTSTLEPIVAYKYPTFRSISPDIGYLRVPSLSHRLEIDVLNKTLNVPVNAGQKRLFIVDIRANGGGFNSTVVRAFLNKLESIPSIAESLGGLIGDDTHSSMPLVRKNSCLDASLLWNTTQSVSSPSDATTLEKIREMQPTLDSIMAGPTSCPVTFSKGDFSWFYGSHKFVPQPGKPIILVLTDELCGSDCEGLLFRFAQSSNSIIAGVNSYGVLQFIQPRQFLLPATRIVVQMATGFSNTYGDDRSVESVTKI